jgi:thiol:disulfide interchange protein
MPVVGVSIDVPARSDARAPLRLRLTALAAAALVGSTLPATAVSAAAAGDRIAAPHVTVTLVSEYRSLRPGTPVSLGLRFEPAEHWHVYWRNPGDSGEAPSVDWSLPPGFDASALSWPAPERIVIGSIVNYAYPEPVLLPVTIHTPDRIATPDRVQLAAKVRWLVCRAEECVPGEARLSVDLPVSSRAPAVDPRAEPWFTEARRRMPANTPAVVEDRGDRVELRLPALSMETAGNARVSFYPLDEGVIDNAAAQIVEARDGKMAIALAKGDVAPARVTTLAGVVVVESPRGRRAFDVHAVQARKSSAWVALLLAFGGGLLLNLMPCVFPVISLKVVGFIQQARKDPAKVRAHGWAFTLGVLASFWVLAGALILLRAGGQTLGWGFQLQSPGFVALLSAVVFILALALCGVFQVGLVLTTIGARGGAASGYGGSFWTGALATVVATPCTAPLMGPALGFALTQPPATAMLVFSALGGGMALPYLALSHFPRLLARLPRPGPWMETFEQLMAFPLFATVLWLLRVFSLQTAPGAVWRLMAALLVIALGAWTWGRFQRAGRTGLQAAALCLVTAAAALALALSATRAPHEATAMAEEGGFWSPWTPARVERLHEEGKPVFVNFTAAWCLSCQVNEHAVFASNDVRELFRRHGVVALKADWTNRDDDIARALEAFGRDGVPLYVYYPPGPGAAPKVLPQIPTERILAEAFES